MKCAYLNDFSKRGKTPRFFFIFTENECMYNEIRSGLATTGEH